MALFEYPLQFVQVTRATCTPAEVAVGRGRAVDPHIREDLHVPSIFVAGDVFINQPTVRRESQMRESESNYGMFLCAMRVELALIIVSWV